MSGVQWHKLRQSQLVFLSACIVTHLSEHVIKPADDITRSFNGTISQRLKDNSVLSKTWDCSRQQKDVFSDRWASTDVPHVTQNILTCPWHICGEHTPGKTGLVFSLTSGTQSAVLNGKFCGDIHAAIYSSFLDLEQVTFMHLWIWIFEVHLTSFPWRTSWTVMFLKALFLPPFCFLFSCCLLAVIWNNDMHECFNPGDPQTDIHPHSICLSD